MFLPWIYYGKIINETLAVVKNAKNFTDRLSHTTVYSKIECYSLEDNTYMKEICDITNNNFFKFFLFDLETRYIEKLSTIPSKLESDRQDFLGVLKGIHVIKERLQNNQINYFKRMNQDEKTQV